MDLPYYFGLPRGAKLALIGFRALKGHTINISQKKACGRNVKVNLLGHWTKGKMEKTGLEPWMGRYTLDGKPTTYPKRYTVC